MFRLITLCLLFWVSNFLEAKCVTETHEFQGELEFEGKPLIGAKITFSALDKLKNEVIASANTNSNGGYTIALSYNKYSGQTFFFGYDKCNFILEETLVSILVPEKINYRETVKLTGNKTTYNKLKNYRTPRVLGRAENARPF